MPLYTNHKALFICLVVFVLLIGFVVIELLIIKYNGTPVPAPDIPRGKQTIGTGEARTYAILGDSTSVSQGGDYTEGYAVKSAEHLAKQYTVTYQNFGVSGARVADVLAKQLPQALELRPDIVLIGIGANDVTHFTDPASINRDMRAITTSLYATNPKVKIIITGSPQMGSVPRFPQPARWLATQRTALVNKVLFRVAADEKLTIAPIAEKTGPIFAAHPELFAKDNFHPTTDGYKLWVEVINAKLAEL